MPLDVVSYCRRTAPHHAVVPPSRPPPIHEVNAYRLEDDGFTLVPKEYKEQGC